MAILLNLVKSCEGGVWVLEAEVLDVGVSILRAFGVT